MSVVGRESVIVGLGSNMGERRLLIDAAVAHLRETRDTNVLRVSTLRETEPVGEESDGPLGGRYLNGVVELETGLDPIPFLERCQAIEEALGRTRSRPNAPRTIDLDLLLFGDRVLDTPRLRVPHPRLLEREFALEPVAEIAPERLHPVSRRTMASHWEELSGRPQQGSADWPR